MISLIIKSNIWILIIFYYTFQSNKSFTLKFITSMFFCTPNNKQHSKVLILMMKIIN